MGLFDTLFGTPGRIEALPSMTGEQSQLLAQLLGGLGGPLQSGLGNIQDLLTGGPGAFEAFEAPAMRQFEEQIVPRIAERFAGGLGGGGLGGQQSSAFAQTLGQAGAGLTERLAGQRAGLQSQALGQLSSLLGLGMGAQPFQYQQIPGQEGGLSKLFGGLGTGLGLAGGAALPGGIGKFGGFLKRLIGGGT